MGSPSDDDGITGEVEHRLDNLFGDEEASAAAMEKANDFESFPLRELKTIVLSIDWEITDEVMTNFVDQIKALKDEFKNDKILLVFLQLLGSLGEYIKVNRGRSHPDAFKILNSSFNQLEKVLQSEELPEAQKKKILVTELNKYKALKEQLTLGQPKKEEMKKGKSPDKRGIDQVHLKDVIVAIEELKEMIKTEFNALREALKVLK